jgi:flagellar assembly protein FliH
MPIPAKAFEYPSVPGIAIPHIARDRELQREQEASAQACMVPGITESDLAAACEKGKKEGRREAESSFNEQLTQAIAAERTRVAKAINDFQQSNSEYYSNVESQVVHLAMGIAAKILHREAQVDPMLIAALVKIATENLKQGSRVQVNIRPEEVASWRTYFEQDGNGRIKIDLIEDPTLSPGDCALHSEVGSADLGINAQLKEIECGLFDLLAQRPKNV